MSQYKFVGVDFGMNSIAITSTGKEFKIDIIGLVSALRNPPDFSSIEDMPDFEATEYIVQVQNKYLYPIRSELIEYLLNFDVIAIEKFKRGGKPKEKDLLKLIRLKDAPYGWKLYKVLGFPDTLDIISDQLESAGKRVHLVPAFATSHTCSQCESVPTLKFKIDKDGNRLTCVVKSGHQVWESPDNEYFTLQNYKVGSTKNREIIDIWAFDSDSHDFEYKNKEHAEKVLTDQGFFLVDDVFHELYANLFICENCGLVIDKDVNAARNVRNEILSEYLSGDEILEYLGLW